MLSPVTITLHATKEASRTARAFVASVADPWIYDDEERRSFLHLAVGEAVANAVRHAGTDITVTICEAGARIRVEVADGSDKLPVVNPSPDGEGGYGLRIIDHCAHAWGVTRLPTGKIVWFEL